MNFFTPAEVAKNYIATGKGKVNTTIGKMLILAVLAGVFIALAGVASATASVSVPQASVGKFLGACVFPGGLTMVLLAGSELFTGNTLLVIPLFQREITWKGMLKNWLFVYVGNLLGSILVAAAVVYCHQLSLFDNGLAVPSCPRQPRNAPCRSARLLSKGSAAISWSASPCGFPLRPKM